MCGLQFFMWGSKADNLKMWLYRVVASKLYGVNATIITFVFVLYCIVYEKEIFDDRVWLRVRLVEWGGGVL